MAVLQMSEQAFLAAMCAAGIEPHGPIDLVAGHLARFRVRGDKAGSKNGAAVYFPEPVPTGWFGSWRTGHSETWRAATAQRLDPATRQALRQQFELLRQVRAAEQGKVQSSARQRAARLWRLARPATNDHPYLQRKGVHAYGIRQLRDALVVPARDHHGELHSLQFIKPDGSKTFLTGGRVRGCYYGIGRPVGRLLMAEGLATASTLHMATGAAVACCFNAGNLLAVAQVLRAKFPRLQLVLVADNDEGTPGNPGVTAARQAARTVGGLLAVPIFQQVAT